MKAFLLNTLLILTATFTFAQADYQKGYYVDYTGKKIDGYFKIVDFEAINSLPYLDFKNELSANTIKLDPNSILEFSIAKELKFQKVKVEIDDDDLTKLSVTKDLVLKSTTLFLNVVLEGKEAILYKHDSGNGTKYFYKINKNGTNNSNPVVQLIYKKYSNSEGQEKINYSFREQLFKEVKCDDQTFNDFINLEYDQNELEIVFRKYNQCKNSQTVSYKNKFEKKIKIQGIGFAGISMLRNPDANQLSVGAEAQLVMPSEKLGFFIKVVYENNKVTPVDKYYTAANFDYHQDSYQVNSNSIDLIFGLRYYVNLSKKHKIFATLGLGANNQLRGLKIIPKITNGAGQFVSGPFYRSLEGCAFFTGGIGYVFDNKFGIDINYDSPKMIYQSLDTNFKIKLNKISISARYRFL